VTQAPAGVRGRQLAPVYAAGFVTAFGAHAVAANLGRYALARHGSLWELGLLLGIYDGAEVVLKPVFGALSDRTGPKPVMVGGLAVFAAASAAFVIGGDPHLLGAARLVQGTGAAAFSPAASATVAALGGKKRSGRLFGGYGGAKGIGYLAGPIAGGALVVAGGYPALFGTLAVIGRPHLAGRRRAGPPCPAGSWDAPRGGRPGPSAHQRRLPAAGPAARGRHRGAIGRRRLPARPGRTAPPRAGRRRGPGVTARSGRRGAAALRRAADR
jgi:MFS family permease